MDEESFLLELPPVKVRSSTWPAVASLTLKYSDAERSRVWR